MKLPKNTNPALVTSKDATRYLLQNVLVTRDLAVATDGRRIVAICTEDTEGDQLPALVPVKAMTAATKKRKPLFQQQLDIQDGKATVRELDELRSFNTQPEADRYPSFLQVFPDPADHTLKLCINAEYLASLVKAMGVGGKTPGAILHIDPNNPDGAIIVTGNTDDPHLSVGVLMPMRPSDEADDLSKNRALARVRIHETATTPAE